MSNLTTHEAEQAAITAAYEARLARMQDQYTLDDWIEAVQVCVPGMWENDTGPADWWAVCNDDGIIAYFGTEIEACCYRLDYINRQMHKRATA